MAVTAGRCGYEQTLTGSGTKDLLFDSTLYDHTADGSGHIHGEAVKGMMIRAIDQPLYVYITPLNSVYSYLTTTGATVVPERVDAGEEITVWAYEGRSGLIEKVEVEAVATAGKVSWAPRMI